MRTINGQRKVGYGNENQVWRKKCNLECMDQVNLRQEYWIRLIQDKTYPSKVMAAIER